MKIINKDNFFGTACTIYAVLSLSKIGLEYIVQGSYGSYQENLLTMFLLSVLGTFVISQHYRFDKYPLLAVIIGQYVALVAVVLLLTWVSGKFHAIHENAYWDMFWSFSIPYAILVVLYYTKLFYEIRCANRALQEVKKLSGNKAKDKEGQ